MRRERLQWMAVRCCCQPTKILGFLQMTEGSFERVVTDNRGKPHRAEVREMSRSQYRGLDDGSSESIFASEKAIYSEDRGIDFWRTISGFMEAVEPALQDRRQIMPTNPFCSELRDQ